MTLPKASNLFLLLAENGIHLLQSEGQPNNSTATPSQLAS